jgi:hypothetical protein
MRISKFASDFDAAYSFIRGHTDNEVVPKELAGDMADLTRAERAEMMGYIESGDYEAFADFCAEHNIQYH